MEKLMGDCMRKIALWYTRTFKPIMTHEELEPIMVKLGFVAQPERRSPNGVVWKEYFYADRRFRCGFTADATAEPPLPRPRLPTHRIDALHIYTYRAFIDAVNFYLELDDISSLFHIRGMPINRVHDRHKGFRRMNEEDSVFVYKEGTLEQDPYNAYHNVDTDDDELRDSIALRNNGKNLSIGLIVPVKDIIVTD